MDIPDSEVADLYWHRQIGIAGLRRILEAMVGWRGATPDSAMRMLEDVEHWAMHALRQFPCKECLDGERLAPRVRCPACYRVGMVVPLSR